MANEMDYFKAILLIQLFFSFCITILAYSLPADSINYVDPFSSVADKINPQNVSNQIESSTRSALKVPVIELGALIFYSGNILIDMMLNFVYAVPEMIGLLLHGFNMLFNIDTTILNSIQIFISVLCTILYFIGIFTLLTNIRGRGALM